MYPSAGINRHTVGNERVLQVERRGTPVSLAAQRVVAHQDSVRGALSDGRLRRDPPPRTLFFWNLHPGYIDSPRACPLISTGVVLEPTRFNPVRSQPDPSSAV